MLARIELICFCCSLNISMKSNAFFFRFTDIDAGHGDNNGHFQQGWMNQANKIHTVVRVQAIMRRKEDRKQNWSRHERQDREKEGAVKSKDDFFFCLVPLLSSIHRSRRYSSHTFFFFFVLTQRRRVRRLTKLFFFLSLFCAIRF